MKRVVTADAAPDGAARYSRLVLAGGAFLALSACTFHHAIAIRYTPLIQTKRLAQVANPEVMTIGQFQDARGDKTLDRERINPISIHHVEYDTIGDVPALVRSAFLDALLKSGFTVPMEGDTATSEPLLRLSGKVLTYGTDLKSHWSSVEVSAAVEVELTLVHRNGKTVTMVVSGKNQAEGKGSLGTDAMVNALDVALQESTKTFLQDERFLALLKE